MPSKNDQIESLEAEISALPIGCISRKTINGKVRQYHQWTEDGKKRSKYLDDESAEQLRTLIEKRKELQRQLRLIRASSVSKAQTKKAIGSVPQFRTNVSVDQALKRFVQPIVQLQKRDGYQELENYLQHESDGRVFILCGLRRTGKTTMIRQVIANMSLDNFSKTAFIQVKPGDTLGDINMDLKWLSENDYQFIFLDDFQVGITEFHKGFFSIFTESQL